jgi:hypothetical protein
MFDKKKREKYLNDTTKAVHTTLLDLDHAIHSAGFNIEHVCHDMTAAARRGLDKGYTDTVSATCSRYGKQIKEIAKTIPATTNRADTLRRFTVSDMRAAARKTLELIEAFDKDLRRVSCPTVPSDTASVTQILRSLDSSIDRKVLAEFAAGKLPARCSQFGGVLPDPALFSEQAIERAIS